MHLRLSSFLFLSAACLSPAADPLPGHSLHGEAFNEGPRQAAVLIPGTGKVDFAISSKNAEAKKFFNQGIGQLHGFWYYEAERSFRQVAVLDPECAMAYWGMAMANVNNDARAKGFVKKAVALKGKASAHEKLWLTTLENFYKEDKRDKKQRALDFIRDLEAIVQEHPEDVEAKAFLAWKIWHAKGEAPISSPQAVDALLDQVFAANPEHPAHHYRIHLWDGSKPARALKSAAQNGQAAPGIAHMWHMPGHTFSKLKRYDDAAWQQEASTRADHAYMIKNWVLPDQIHNYAHNEEWLVRTFNELGRAKEAIALAKSLIANPRHPKYNTLAKGSASYGRTRLIETLLKWEMWDELLAVTDSPLIAAVDDASHEVTRRRARGIAFYEKGDLKSLDINIAHLDEWQWKAKKQAAKKPKIGASKGAKKPEAAASAAAELRALRAVLAGTKDASAKLKAATEMPKERAAVLWLKLGDKKQAEASLKGMPEDIPGLAAKAETQAALGKMEEAKKTLKQAGKLAFSMDADLAVGGRFDALASRLGLKDGWRGPAPKRDDSGERPALDTLGPMHWQPPGAPKWEALTLDGKPVDSSVFAGKPHILLFYLGSACGHCMEQVNAFNKVAQDYEKAGIQLAAVTLEPMSLAGRITEQMKTGQLPAFPIYCNPGLEMFKSFRAYDDFEEEPLHAAVLVDAQGRLRWWDVSWEPFSDTGFLLAESQRLLSLE
ncbi:redoxin domain-containing protein [Prosthecobacter sp. SYSU 5D2]|uniref:redoxin domain-containing protein n=1 Tax=Prosthecobacter sp. SYSU 5D2 TaxID=3134134 RepID=UPI0031FE85B8